MICPDDLSGAGAVSGTCASAEPSEDSAVHVNSYSSGSLASANSATRISPFTCAARVCSGAAGKPICGQSCAHQGPPSNIDIIMCLYIINVT